MNKKIVMMQVTYQPAEVWQDGIQEVRIEVRTGDQKYTVSKLFPVDHFQPVFDFLIADAVTEIKKVVNGS